MNLSALFSNKKHPIKFVLKLELQKNRKFEINEDFVFLFSIFRNNLYELKKSDIKKGYFYRKGCQ